MSHRLLSGGDRAGRGAERGRLAGGVTEVRAVITDWGGVMTSPITETINAWIIAEGIGPGTLCRGDAVPGGCRPTARTARRIPVHAAGARRVHRRGVRAPAGGRDRVGRRRAGARGGAADPDVRTPCCRTRGCTRCSADLPGRRSHLPAVQLLGPARYPRELFGELFDAVSSPATPACASPRSASSGMRPSCSGCRRRSACSSTTWRPTCGGRGHRDVGIAPPSSPATIARLRELFGRPRPEAGHHPIATAVLL